MRVLITGARAPACLEWARALRRAGCSVAVADSVWMPISRFSFCVERWYRLPAPVKGVNEYGEALVKAAQDFRADLILPTCEEALYIAHQKRRLERQCRVFVSDFDLMTEVHDKWSFAELTRDLPIMSPHTVRLKSDSEVAAQVGCADDLVFKPVYSRFAADIHIRPKPQDLAKIHPSPGNAWIAQRFVAGKEMCSFSILQEGHLLAHSCYNPRYRVGTGSGIYLQPLYKQPIQSFVRSFGLKTGYTGQVGFDFIEAPEGGIAVLECNPRATSGIHLFDAQYAELANALRIPHPESTLEARGSARMVKLAMTLFAAPKLRCDTDREEFARAMQQATDIIADPNDRRPELAQFLGLGEIAVRAMFSRRSMLSASTQDIEWNGQPLGPQP